MEGLAFAQIDEFLKTGTLAALKKDETEEKKGAKDADMALKFI